MGLYFPFIIRRVQGSSMLPTLKQGKIIVGWRYVRHLKPGHIVVIRHQGREMVKRLKDIETGRLYVVGDNLSASTDSRSFGRISKQQVVAKVLRVS